MADTLKDIPEFFEAELGESIAARTDALGNEQIIFPHPHLYRTLIKKVAF
jgi:hypothetical protein